MQDEVLEFINRRWQCDAGWLTGNCYWFAAILCKRFPHLEVFYLPVEGHFVAGINGRYYDWGGEYKPEQKPISLFEIQNTDPAWYHRLIRDCVL